MTTTDEELDELAPPQEPIDRLVEPFERFLHVEAAGGAALLLATAVALIAANSVWADAYLAIWNTEFGFRFGTFESVHSLKHWISDGLMALFFFVIGLEVKRELVSGELREIRNAALPIAAALGGMLVPVGVFLLMQGEGPGQRGWGIPMATDIAFVVGCLAVLGKRVPPSLRVLLVSLAIVDDIGAILVIAVGYTSHIQGGFLALGCTGIAVVTVAARLGVRSMLVYTLLGVFIWEMFHESGIHATIAGVILGLQTPAKSYVSENFLAQYLRRGSDLMHGGDWTITQHRAARVREARWKLRESIPPLEFLEGTLHPWTTFLVIPLFALANAGVPLDASAFTEPIALAVGAGLVLGKPLGILAFSWLAIRAGVARMPAEFGWGAIAGGGMLAGIGFTMSLFISGLALDGDTLLDAKVGVLAASGIAAIVGLATLARVLPRPGVQGDDVRP